MMMMMIAVISEYVSKFGWDPFSDLSSGVTERLEALGHSDTLGPNLSWALAGYHI